MNYYNIHTHSLHTEYEVQQKVPPEVQNLREEGYWPVEYLPPAHDADRHYARAVGEPTLAGHGRAYVQAFELVPLPLENMRGNIRARLQAALQAVDARAAGPLLTRVANQAAGLPDSSGALLDTLEAIKEANRELLHALEAATSWEEAAAIRPWLPWEEPTKG